MTYPDYGTPGNPSLDPYYLSAKEKAALDKGHQAKIDDFHDAVQNLVNEDSAGLTPEEVLDVLIAVMSDLRMTPAK